MNGIFDELLGRAVSALTASLDLLRRNLSGERIMDAVISRTAHAFFRPQTDNSAPIQLDVEDSPAVRSRDGE